MIRQTTTLIALGLIALLLSGCIYLRLLELKKQLANFDRHFEVDARDGIKLTCKTPVLLDEDMAFFKLAPEFRQRVGVAERWYFRWIKTNPAPGENPSDHEITADFIYVEGKLTRIILPERFFTFLPKPLFLLMLRSLGHAEIDRAKRTARSQVNGQPGGAPPLPPLNQAGLTSMLGAPREVQSTETELRWNYRFHGASADQRAGRIDVAFVLNPATQQVRRVKGQVFDVTIDLAWPDQPPSK